MAFSDRQRCSTTGSFGSWRRPTRWFCCRFSILHLPREQEPELYWSHHHHACQIIAGLPLLAEKSVLICADLLHFFDKHITISVIIHHSWNSTCLGGNNTCCYSNDQTTNETATKTTLIRSGEQTLSGSSVRVFYLIKRWKQEVRQHFRAIQTRTRGCSVSPSTECGGQEDRAVHQENRVSIGVETQSFNQSLFWCFGWGIKKNKMRRVALDCDSMSCCGAFWVVWFQPWQAYRTQVSERVRDQLQLLRADESVENPEEIFRLKRITQVLVGQVQLLRKDRKLNYYNILETEPVCWLTRQFSQFSCSRSSQLCPLSFLLFLSKQASATSPSNSWSSEGPFKWYDQKSFHYMIWPTQKLVFQNIIIHVNPLCHCM